MTSPSLLDTPAITTYQLRQDAKWRAWYFGLTGCLMGLLSTGLGLFLLGGLATRVGRSAPDTVSWPDLAYLVVGVLFVAVGLFFSGLAVLVILQAAGMEVRLSSPGVELQTTGYRLQSPWTNLERTAQFLGNELWILRHPAPVSGPAAWLVRLYRADRFITLTPYQQWIGAGHLKDRLREHVPWLTGA